MRQFLQRLVMVALVGLAGCSDGPAEPIISDGSGGKGNVALTKPVFQPSSGKLPLPNDLLFSGSLNLTLNPPVTDATNYTDPLVALSAMDGWSATAPFGFSFVNESNSNEAALVVKLKPTTVIPGRTVRMFKVSVNRPVAISGSTVIVPTGPVTGIEKELVAGVDFVAALTGDLNIAVVPLKPLVQQASYMVVVTNGIVDTNGNATVADGQYAIAKTTSPIPEGLPTSGLEPVRQLVNAMENAAVTAGIAKADITLSFQLTVQSIGELVASAKLAYIDAAIAAGAKPYSSFSSLMTDTSLTNGSGDANLYKGEFRLNFYLTAPSPENPYAAITQFFTGADQVPDGKGGVVANPFAKDVTTYANRLPQIMGIETVPLLVSMPKAAACPKPIAGYPVMIFQHSINSNRTGMLGIADSMAKAGSCTAVIAMDLPLHGIAADNPIHQGVLANSGGAVSLFEGYAAAKVRERTFGVDYVNNTTGEVGADLVPDTSGKHFINFSNLLTTRDNGRQAILDLLALEKAIETMDIDSDSVPDFDKTKVSFMGHSLGGVIGVGFLGHSDLVQSAILANVSGGLALMLDASPTFGPEIRAGLAAVGVEAGTADYDMFLFVAQTLIDSIDPASTATFANVNNIPMLIIQNANDTVMPHSVATAPQSGTSPLAVFLGANALIAAEAGFVPGHRIFARYNTGGHASVLIPTENPALTREMQTHIVTFTHSSKNNKGVTVTDPTLLVQ